MHNYDTVRHSTRLQCALLAALWFAAEGGTAHAGFIYVGASRSLTTITDGINAAAAGDTILIDDGIYAEYLTVNKQLTFQAVNVGGAIVEGATAGQGVLFNLHANAQFNGLYLRNAGYGLYQRDTYVTFNARQMIFSDLTSAIVINNSAARQGGGALVNSTIVNAGRGIHINDGGAVSVTNTIFDNVGTAYEGGNTPGITPSHNLLHNVTTVAAGTVFADPSVIVRDPMFVNRAAGDYRLLTGSPGIDSGTLAGLPYTGAAPDRGAFEGAISVLSPVPEPSTLGLSLIGFVAIGAISRWRK